MGDPGICGEHAVAEHRLVYGDRRAVAFEAADIAAIACLAVHVYAHMADLRGRAERAVDHGAVIDDAQAYAFAEQIVCQILIRRIRVEEILGECAGAGVLFYDHRHVEGMFEFGAEVDLSPLFHG